MTDDFDNSELLHEISDDELAHVLKKAGLAANRVARRNVFDEYRATKSANTLQAQDHDLQAFEEFLSDLLNVNVRDFATRPTVWQNITWGLVEAFKRQHMREGYALSTINRRLSTIRVYVRLAHKADVLSLDEMRKICSVSGYAGKEAKNVDEKRSAAGIGTRQRNEHGSAVKKAQHVSLSQKDVKQLLHNHDDTPQGRRDAVMMALLLEHGLRCSEVVDLQVSNINMERQQIHFYRAKVGKTQIHQMTTVSQKALQAYISAGDIPNDPDAALLRASHRSGSLLSSGLSRQAISQRVRQLGERAGVEGLSAHDCRHNWATRAANGGTSPFVLQEAGGWNSLSMPRRYVEDNTVANEDIKFKDD